MRRFKHLLSLTACFLGAMAFAQIQETNKPSDEFQPEPVNGQTWGGPRGTVLYDNGPFVTSPGTGVGGADESVLQNTSLGMTNLGGAGNLANNDSRIADDFTVPATVAGWEIDAVTAFAYQTSAPTAPSPIATVNLNIWDGEPSTAGSTIVASFPAPPFTSTFSNIFRVTETTTGTATNRAVFANVIDLTTGGLPLFLPPGTYWFDIQYTGSASFSGPWLPPITLVGQTTTGNGRQLFMGLWQDFLDGGTATQQGLPFIFEGTEVPLCQVTSITVDGDQVTITGDCPDGLDLYCEGANGLVLLASGIVFSGSITLTVPFHPDAVYFGALPGENTPLGGITSARTIPTLQTWGLVALLVLLAGTAVFFLRRNRKATA